ncbi:energy transducer TonB [Chryseolinea lacunae]|nr:energy transducer TonB [Chryseolinea lacunae]
MKPCVTFILLLISLIASGQDAELPREYFNHAWEVVSDPKDASYYRTVEEKEGLVLMNDYFISGQLEEHSEFRVVDGLLVKDGRTVIYYPDGALKRDGTFEKDAATGIHTFYYTTGKPRLVRRHNGDKITYIHYWSPTGQELIPNGNGLVVHEPINNTVAHDYVKDSISVVQYEVKTLTHDTLYTLTDTPPEFKGGLKAMSKAVGQTLKYPAPARSAGAQGVTFIMFVVEVDGSITNAEIRRGFDMYCDQEALRTVKAIANWKPGKVNGKVVRCRFVLPIRFKLG